MSTNRRATFGYFTKKRRVGKPVWMSWRTVEKLASLASYRYFRLRRLVIWRLEHKPYLITAVLSFGDNRFLQPELLETGSSHVSQLCLKG